MSAMGSDSVDVAVIGAGIVGLAAALRLQLDGRTVTLLDPDEPAAGASYGNAGYLSQGNIFPPSSVATLKRLPRMLLDPMGPLVIRPGYLPRFLPWGLRALAAARPAVMKETIAALASLARPSVAAYTPLLQAAGAEDLIDAKGSLVLYRTEAELEAAGKSAAFVGQFGIGAEVVPRHEVRQFEPALADTFAGAVRFPGSARAPDPQMLGRRFAEAVIARGGEHRRLRVSALQPASGGGWTITTDGGAIGARDVVVAAGRWSDRLLRPLGYRVPLEGERGYHLMLPAPGVELRRPVVIADHQICVTPMNAGLRLAGTVEFAADGAPMNPRRADMLFDIAAPYLPGLSREGASRWMGVRPSLPDGRPAIGRASRHAHLYYCFGHQHVGLTQAAVSASLLADVMAGGATSIDPRPFNLDRF
jgi:D-amino-acid dehydrogenase